MGVAVVDCLSPEVLAGVDQVIDVRSPSEFAEDHVPGAVNLPVLSDVERARIGTIYVQEDKFRARREGAALIARNVAVHLEGPLADRPGSWRPLVYCWRGGQRSNAMATILSQVGWRTSLLGGGYRTYRRGVTAALYDGVTRLPPFALLAGGTGVGKTELLGRLLARGMQVLDLEGMAAHRGSLLGALPGRPQPSQKLWESRLHAALAALDPDRPVVVEAESSKVGERLVPPAVWDAMARAPAVELAAPVEARAAYLAQAYGDVAADRAGLAELLDRLPRHLGGAEVEGWRALLAAGDLTALARVLVERHYDPAYTRSAAVRGEPALGRVDLADLSEAGQEHAADEVVRRLRDRFGRV